MRFIDPLIPLVFSFPPSNFYEIEILRVCGKQIESVYKMKKKNM